MHKRALFLAFVLTIMIISANYAFAQQRHPYQEITLPVIGVWPLLDADTLDGFDSSDLLGGSSVWTQSGSDIYYDTGRVGIGTNSLGSVDDHLYLRDGGMTIDSDDGTDDITLRSFGWNKADVDFYRAFGTRDSMQTLGDHEMVGTLRFYSYCGAPINDFDAGAQIMAVSEDSHCSVPGDVPMSLKFLTRDNVHSGSPSAAPLEVRMTIDRSGRVYVGEHDRLNYSTEGNMPGSSLVVDNGILCVDDGNFNCDDAGRTAGRIYAESTSISGIDIAENYPTKDPDLDAGSLVSLDLNNPIFVQRSLPSLPLIGIVSTEPGMILGDFGSDMFEDEMSVPVALKGRVPAKVSLENGPISIGDLIGPSHLPGVGMKAEGDVSSVGIALEPFGKADANPDGSGKIMVFVNLMVR